MNVSLIVFELTETIFPPISAALTAEEDQISLQHSTIRSRAHLGAFLVMSICKLQPVCKANCSVATQWALAETGQIQADADIVGAGV